MNPGPHLSLPGRNRGGVALVMTLAILTLTALMVIVFVSLATADRQATQNYSGGFTADQMALNAVDQTISAIQAEITDPSHSTTNSSGNAANPFTIYIPGTNFDAVPQRASSTLPVPVVTYSGANFYTNAAHGGITNIASACYSTNASLNGRRVSINRWLAPRLVINSAGFPAPKWVLVTRSGTRVFPGYDASVASDARNNSSYVVGRYAYVVYDTSGLLDVNVAGYPSSVAAGVIATNKGPEVWADLTQLSSSITPSDVSDLINWRNKANAANYAAYVPRWTTNGFMRVASGDTAFLGRQELIQYAQTQNGDLTNALPFLTTFSREVNGPTWGPTTNLGGNYQYQLNATTASSTNVLAFVPRVARPGGWIRNNGTNAVAGEPLVKYRFPLDQLALFNKMATVGLNPQDIATLQKYFGLDVSPDASGYYRHLNYPTVNGNYPHTASAILTLAQVAALTPAREPDFFELLQAGILQGSLGAGGTKGRIDASPLAPPGNFYPATWINPDAQTSYQLIRIGANIINQTVVDNYPITITFGGNDFYGTEDLPYIAQFLTKAYSPTAATGPFQFYGYCELWNPHQTSPTTPSLSPTKFQISPMPSGNASADNYKLGFAAQVSGNTCLWYWNGSTDPGAVAQYFSNLPNPSSKGNVQFTAQPTDFRQPALIGSAQSPTINTFTLPVASSPLVGGWSLGTISTLPPAANSATGGDTTKTWSAVGASDPSKWSLLYKYSGIFRLQCLYPDGQYHTYGTFVGLDNASVATGFQATSWLPSQDVNPITLSYSYVKSDPRTWRFGPGLHSILDNAVGSLNPTSTTFTSEINGQPPFSNYTVANNSTAPYRMDLWSVNDPTVAIKGGSGSRTPPWYAAPDGVTRGGDSKYSYAGGVAPVGSPFYTPAAPATSVTDSPVILHRPFQSVGELGYAYRDEPWKTLDFFSPDSADAGLLDLFSAHTQPPVVAGRFSPNTPYPQVLAALISGEMQSSLSAGASVATANVAPNSALAVGKALCGITTNMPFMNRADLVTRGMTNNAMATLSSAGAKTEREAVVRALVESANTRTWNFLIDIVAQSGRYPESASTLDNFFVSGEKHYWLHLAIDRYTGQVVDKQLEVVNQ